MSTCPDPDLYSAYVDNEVPSPWKEKLEAHIASCPDCRNRTDRYLNLKKSIGAGTAVLSGVDLEDSFSRLAARRQFAAPSSVPAWSRLTVRIPVPALAALFLAAVFLPAYFVQKTNTRTNDNLAQSSALLPGISTSGATISQTMKALSTSTSVYSPDLASYASTSNMLDANNRQIFTMINFAKQFAADKDLFSDAEIIIIKLPDLSRFSNTGERLFTDGEILQQAAGFYR